MSVINNKPTDMVQELIELRASAKASFEMEQSLRNTLVDQQERVVALTARNAELLKAMRATVKLLEPLTFSTSPMMKAITTLAASAAEGE